MNRINFFSYHSHSLDSCPTTKSKQLTANIDSALILMCPLSSTDTHVFEAPIKGLQLLLGEFGLSLQLLQTLGLMSHRGQLEFTVTALYGRERAKKERGRGGKQRDRGRRGREGGELMACRTGWGERAFQRGRQRLRGEKEEEKGE